VLEWKDEKQTTIATRLKRTLSFTADCVEVAGIDLCAIATIL
jgi:hypothetical protein